MPGVQGRDRQAAAADHDDDRGGGGMRLAQPVQIRARQRCRVQTGSGSRLRHRDLHSGVFGGAAQNPLRLLSTILGAMWDDRGRVTLPGFYEGVTELPADIKADLKGLDLTPEKFLGPIGLKIPAGEKDRMLIEMVTTRPTAEINGIVGGYTGEGAKTVIPGEASAKVSFRLVGTQDPEKIRDSFRAFVRARLPADC